MGRGWPMPASNCVARWCDMYGIWALAMYLWWQRETMPDPFAMAEETKH